MTSLTVTFSTVVRFLGSPTDAFRLVGPHGAFRLHAEAMLNASGTATVVRLIFADRRVTAVSLTDGPYTLTIDGDRIVDASGTAVDGDGDGAAGGDTVEKFFRLYGDSEGDRDLDDDDLAVLVSKLSKQSGDEGYLSYFDINGNDRIDRKDKRQVLAKFALVPGQ